MAVILALTVLLGLTSTWASTERSVQKRQIFREQVLPHAGGKIPDTAFHTDRLFLNRLQKEGIAIPDGIVLEQRNPQVYPAFNKQMRTVFKVALSSDGRYISPEGQYTFDNLPSVDTTYLVPQVHNYPERKTPRIPAYPTYKQIEIQNPLLNQPKFHPKKKSYYFLSPYGKNSEDSYDKINIFKPKTKTIGLLNAPLNTNYDQHYQQNYEPLHLFNEFNSLFNDPRGSYKYKVGKRPLNKIRTPY